MGDSLGFAKEFFGTTIASSERGDLNIPNIIRMCSWRKEFFTMAIKPLGDRVLVKRIEDKEEKQGGIIIPDTAKEKPQEAEVVEIGSGKKDKDGKTIPMEVKKGDRVLISKYGGTDVKLNGTDYVIIREDDILGVIEK